MFLNTFKNLFKSKTALKKGIHRRLELLRLEERVVPATFTVTNTNDTGANSLSQAILDANASPANDIIDFNFATGTSPYTITLAAALPNIVDASTAGTLTITGLGASSLTIDGSQGGFSIFSINTGGDLTISGVTVSGANNNVSTVGGAFYNDGNLTITNSTLSSNTATRDGGGIYNGGTLTVTNSTLSGNTASNKGGGIYNFNATLAIANTIIANSTSGGDYAGSGTVHVTSPSTAANNLVSQGSFSWATTKTSAQINLGTLSNNGGPTQTLALLNGSVAIGAASASISNAPPINGCDQRGFSRSSTTPSIGAYELNPDTFGCGSNQFTIDFVNVGNAGNSGDGNSRHNYGSVPYEYRISTYEVSQSNITMATNGGLLGVTAGAWSPNQPAAFLKWYEAAAFVNWLNTESGNQPAYNLTYNGGSINSSWVMSLWSPEDAWQNGGQNLFRNENAYYFLPNENEWFKSAYQINNGVTAGYWNYPTGSNTAPTSVLSGTAAGTAVYGQSPTSSPSSVYSAGGLSAYGTMGQGGNVAEWLETSSTGSNTIPYENRIIIGGAVNNESQVLQASNRTTFSVNPAFEDPYIGFRIASATVGVGAISGPSAIPVFGAPTPTADGFTVQITNFNGAFTHVGTATANGTVAISNTGLVTVRGVAANTSSTVTITTTRANYVSGSAQVTATSNIAPLVTSTPPPPSSGGSSTVTLHDPVSGAETGTAIPFPGFSGPIKVVSGDFNNDGVADIIAGAGFGGGPAIAILDSQTGEVMESFFAFDPSFTGGVFVAVQDVNGDGILDIIAGAGPSGGPEVRIFDGSNLNVLRSFFAYDQSFSGGVSVACIDFNNDGILDIVTGAGPGAAPHVKVFDGATNAIISQWYAYPASFTGGVYVAAGDIGNDGNIEVVTGAGAGGAPVVAVWNPYTGALLAQFMAYAEDFTGGVRVGINDGNSDSIADILTGAGPGGGPQVNVFSFPALDLLFSFYSGAPANTGGVFVS